MCMQGTVGWSSMGINCYIAQKVDGEIEHTQNFDKLTEGFLTEH